MSGITPFSRFNIEWGLDEPNAANGANCAILSKSKGYKLKAVNCLEPKSFLCMANAPKCPEGFQWAPSVGIGRSCFKITPPILASTTLFNNEMLYDVTIADKFCQASNSRPFVPDSTDEIAQIHQWVTKPGNSPHDNANYLAGIMKVEPSTSKDGGQNQLLLATR